MHVTLSSPPQMLFELIATLGPTLQLTRNAAATLGTRGELPRLTDWRNPATPQDQAGEFRLNLAEIDNVCAISELTPVGLVYGFALQQLDGTTSQRIVLTADSDLRFYSDFVAFSQSAWGKTTPWIAPNHAASLAHRRVLRSRIPYLRYREARMDSGVQSLPRIITRDIFTELAADTLGCRVTFFNPSVARSVTIAPPFDCHPGSEDTLECVMAENFSLHFQAEAFRTIWLSRNQCLCCGKGQCTLEFGDEHDHLSFTISAASKSQEEHWDSLVTKTFERQADIAV